MKIIGIVEGKNGGKCSRVLAEISAVEIANICGKLYSGNEIAIERDKSHMDCCADALTVGDVMQVSELYEKARESKEVYSDISKALSNAKGTITKLQNLMK